MAGGSPRLGILVIHLRYLSPWLVRLERQREDLNAPNLVRFETHITFRVSSTRYLSHRLVIRDTRGWGESQAGDIRFYTLRYLSPRLGGSPRLVLRVPRGWGEAQAGDIRLNRLERIENYRTDRELYNV